MILDNISDCSMDIQVSFNTSFSMIVPRKGNISESFETTNRKSCARAPGKRCFCFWERLQDLWPLNSPWTFCESLEQQSCGQLAGFASWNGLKGFQPPPLRFDGTRRNSPQKKEVGWNPIIQTHWMSIQSLTDWKTSRNLFVIIFTLGNQC